MRREALGKLIAFAASLDDSENIIELGETGTLPKSKHRIDPSSVDAIIAAVAADRPLLILGEPGVGKSQLARAAAAMLECPLMSTVIQPHTEYEELLWNVDLTRRLGEAQLLGARLSGTIDSVKDYAAERQTIDDLLAIKRFINPGPLWYAFEPGYVHQHPTVGFQPDPPLGTQEGTGLDVVLLIDEIDKADIALCNGLLEALGNRGFHVPPLGRHIRSSGQGSPLIIITSNNTRDLPPAFMRRCAVLTLSLPEEELEQHLIKIARAAQPELQLSDEVLHQAAKQLVTERNRTPRQPRVGQAEFLDLVRSLNQVAEAGHDPAAYLSRLEPYFHKQH